MADAITDADHLAIAAAIGRPLAPPPPSRVADVLAVALAVLRTTIDVHAIEVIVVLVDELLNAVKDAASVRAVLSETLTRVYEQHAELARLRRRLAEGHARARAHR